jgi:hypothetical protein
LRALRVPYPRIDASGYGESPARGSDLAFAKQPLNFALNAKVLNATSTALPVPGTTAAPVARRVKVFLQDLRSA